MSEYERLTTEEGGEFHDQRYRQRTLQRWRFSIALSFLSGVMVTAVAYPRISPCADLQKVAAAAAARCPACPACAAPPTESIVSAAVQKAVSSCPTCPKCPDFPGCPACPPSRECPTIPACNCGSSGAAPPALPDATVAARHRELMLSRGVGKNIIECAPGQDCRMSSVNRAKILKQKGVTMWMTGLSGSGKTTISEALEKRLLLALGKNVYRIDGDNLRTGLTRDLGFSASDRGESVRRASEVAQLFSEAGIITMVTLISPYRKDRDAARAAHERKGIPFVEVFMDVPLSVVQARDPKGLYAKVKAGLIKNFTGVDAPYEVPLKPEVHMMNHQKTVDQCVDELVLELRRRGFLSGDP